MADIDETEIKLLDEPQMHMNISSKVMLVSQSSAFDEEQEQEQGHIQMQMPYPLYGLSQGGSVTHLSTRDLSDLEPEIAKPIQNSKSKKRKYAEMTATDQEPQQQQEEALPI